MTRLSSAEFYSALDQAPQQGDILLGAVSRVVAGDDFSPPRWQALDECRAVLAGEVVAGDVTVPELRVCAGRALVMVTSHDCGLDKEFNAAVTVLTEGGMDEAEAMRAAEAQDNLDRSFSVSPLVDAESVSVAGKPVDQGLLLAGRVVGYLPVPELTVAGRVVVPASVVDLSYRATLDRLAYAQRITCVGEAAREQLRYALARLDVLRTPSLELQLSAAVGQAITSAKVLKKNPLIVQLKLGDGTTVELLKQPGSPPPGPVTRSRRSVRGAAN